MKKRELLNIGFEAGALLDKALEACDLAKRNHIKKPLIRSTLKALIKVPAQYLDHPIFCDLASLTVGHSPHPPQEYSFNQTVQFSTWGADSIDQESKDQMHNACQLPVAIAGALMPDAHVGYGLPIGGVLATDNAVIPYAVGVDIACRVMLTVLDMPLSKFFKNSARFERILEEQTRFGIGAKWQPRKHHPVLDKDWSFCQTVREVRDLAWSQLGTSGSGNHFVEFGEFELSQQLGSLAPGSYLALVSHSGSRGPGNRIASHYSQLARKLHPKLPNHLRHLAWLSLDTEEGAEYWQAMELMGQYASANHHLIHRGICQELGGSVLLQVENHHNFAWLEEYQGCPVVIHRKGATPADKGVLGYIPGSMTAPGYLVQGLGKKEALNSCSHGAGRLMSRKQAKNSTTYHQLKKSLKEAKVQLISAGLDESPHAYKDIEEVMLAQSDLIKKLGKFQPRLVKMAPAGERGED